jgi:hypothetical protein
MSRKYLITVYAIMINNRSFFTEIPTIFELEQSIAHNSRPIEETHLPPLFWLFFCQSPNLYHHWCQIVISIQIQL